MKIKKMIDICLSREKDRLWKILKTIKMKIQDLPKSEKSERLTLRIPKTLKLENLRNFKRKD